MMSYRGIRVSVGTGSRPADKAMDHSHRLRRWIRAAVRYGTLAMESRVPRAAEREIGIGKGNRKRKGKSEREIGIGRGNRKGKSESERGIGKGNRPFVTVVTRKTVIG